MAYQGAFNPPAIGGGAVPIGIAGPGTCKIDANGVEITGFKHKSKSGFVAIYILATLIVSVVLISAFNAPPWIIGPLILPAVFMMVKKGEYDPKRPVTIPIPWASIKSVVPDAAQKGGVVMRVVNFRPKGTIHFTPAGGVDTMLKDVGTFLKQ